MNKAWVVESNATGRFTPIQGVTDKSCASIVLKEYSSDNFDTKLVEYSPSNQWRPIAEAPRDGEMLDLWNGEKRFADFMWVSGWPYGSHDDGEWRDKDGNVASGVTHFMLPPSPPEGLK